MHDDGGGAMIEAETAEGCEVLPGRADAGLVLLCDHASNRLPPEYGSLGLAAAELERHIAYDIGAAAVTRRLSATLGVPAVLTRTSRLLIDVNRGEDDPTLIMRLSDGVIIPGNRHPDATERDRRIERWYRPYDRAITRVLDRCVAAGEPPAVLAIHSFTDVWKGAPRPWSASVLWQRDPRLALPLLAALRADGGLVIGENEPYPGEYEGDTLWRHGLARGLACAIVEMRQDLIAGAAGQHAWGDRLALLLRGLLARPDLALQLRTPLAASADDTASCRPHIERMRYPVEGHPAKGHLATESHMTSTPDATRTELEAAAFRKLVAHLRDRTDVQNIDLMTLAGFCRNCLANWYQEAENANGGTLSKDGAREIVYGMPYKEWQARHQKDATPDQKAAFDKSKPHQH